MKTAKDIAKETGYSLSTVTKVMRGHAERYNIKKETAEKIMNVAGEMGYCPSFAATALASKQTKIIGFICGTIDNPFFADLVNELMVLVEGEGYKLMVLATSWDARKELEALEWLLGGVVDGILMFSNCFSEHPEYVKKIKKRSIPVVLLNNKHDELSSVSFDLNRGFEAAFGELIATNHNNIAYAGEKKSKKPVEAYQRCCLSLALNEILYMVDSSAEKELKSLANHICADINKVDAIICNDYLAEKLVQELDIKGISVPGSLSLISLDNTRISQYFRPPLTSIDLNRKRMVQVAVDLLWMQINKSNEYTRQDIVIQTELIIRKSVETRKKRN